ncbi:hypothetical protein L7F22_001277 [Adiantum nelumboides]|nr:hypothetical protein [Adiantum nelumboides]
MKEQCQEDKEEDSTPNESEEQLTCTTSKEEDSDLITKEDSSIEVMGIRLRPLNENQDIQVGEEVQTQEQPQGHEEMIEGMLCKTLTHEEKVEYKQMLQKFPSLFVKDYIDVKGVDAIQHQIELKPKCHPQAQKLRRLGVVKEEAHLKEVKRLQSAVYIAKEDQRKTILITPWGCYAFRVMPFGLTNAPTTFQRFMNYVFQAFFGKSIRVFIDDFSIYSPKSIHTQMVEEGLQRLDSLGGQLNPKKCHIGEDEDILLGHKISQRGIEVDAAKTKALIEIPSPKSVKEVTSFMQKVKYLSRFIHLASELLNPLQNLTEQVEFACLMS